MLDFSVSGFRGDAAANLGLSYRTFTTSYFYFCEDNDYDYFLVSDYSGNCMVKKFCFVMSIYGLGCTYLGVCDEVSKISFIYLFIISSLLMLS